MQKWTNADRGRRVVSQMRTSVWKKIIATIFVKFTQINEIFFFPDNDFGTLAFLLGQSCLCVTFTSWSTPSFGVLLSKLSKNTHVCISSIKMINFFLPFSVNCSQVAMFQIMPALCLHGQGEGRGGQTNVLRPGQGERGPKNCQICADILYG